MAKKVLIGLILMSFLALPMVVGAWQQQWGRPQFVSSCVIAYDLSDVHPSCGQGQTVNVDRFGICCAFNAVYMVTGWIFWFLLALVVLLVIIGAFFILTAAGDAAKVTTGRNFIIYACIGLIIALMARAIPSIAKALMGLVT